jgi:hypothetical protein
MTKSQVRQLLLTNPRAVERAILALYHCQTVDEQRSSATCENNGKGFSAAHAERGSYLARWLLSGRHLTGPWVDKARAIALHYCGQLSDMSRLRATVVTTPLGTPEVVIHHAV